MGENSAFKMSKELHLKKLYTKVLDETVIRFPSEYWFECAHHISRSTQCPLNCIYIPISSFIPVGLNPEIYIPVLMHGCFYNLVEKKVIRTFSYEYISEVSDKRRINYKDIIALSACYYKSNTLCIGTSSLEDKVYYSKIVEEAYKTGLLYHNEIKVVTFLYEKDTEKNLFKSVKNLEKSLKENTAEIKEAEQNLCDKGVLYPSELSPLLSGISNDIMLCSRSPDYISYGFIKKFFKITSEDIDNLKLKILEDKNK